ncbi:MAG: hypothetical protein COA94_01965 [Rickettsiales bacterium]|nr:MAG: hypothetical protein COA94_01965 [Rickettsiales bacterium]
MLKGAAGGNIALNVASVAKTYGRFDTATAINYLNEQTSGMQPKKKRRIKWGKIAHDVIVPTRLVAAGFSALSLQAKKAEIGTNSAFARGGLRAIRLLSGIAELALHAPELATTPIAHLARATAKAANKGRLCVARKLLSENTTQDEPEQRPNVEIKGTSLASAAAIRRKRPPRMQRRQVSFSESEMDYSDSDEDFSSDEDLSFDPDIQEEAPAITERAYHPALDSDNTSKVDLAETKAAPAQDSGATTRRITSSDKETSSLDKEIVSPAIITSDSKKPALAEIKTILAQHVSNETKIKSPGITPFTRREHKGKTDGTPDR